MFSIDIDSPSDFINKIKNKIDPWQKTAFISAFIIGLCCHLFIFTNSMYNNDDIRYLYVTFDKPELGRWLQTYAAGVSSYFSMPVVNGLLSVLYLSLTSMIIVKMFHLKKKWSIVCVSGILVTFPSVASIFSYMFAADAFFLGCLLSTLSAYYTIQSSRKWHWLLGSLFLCMSVGIYQAYLPFTLLFLILYFMLMLLAPGEYKDAVILSTAIRFVKMVVLGMTAYYLFMQLTLKLKHTALSSYQGIGDSSVPGIHQIKQRFINIFTDFFAFFKPDQVLTHNTWLLLATVCCLLLLLLFFVRLYLTNRIYLSPLRNFFLAACMICIPVSLNIMYLISEGVTYHMLMRHAWCILFIAVCVFLEKTDLSGIWLRLLEWTAFVSLFLVIFNYFLLSNIAYFNMNFRYEKTYALCVKIMDRIQQSEDYDNDRPIAFIGNYSKTYKMEACEELLEPMTGMKGPLVFRGASRAFQPFIQNCLGEDITIPAPEEETQIKATEEFQEMPRFPKEGSIRVINDITVVKLNDD